LYSIRTSAGSRTESTRPITVSEIKIHSLSSEAYCTDITNLVHHENLRSSGSCDLVTLSTPLSTHQLRIGFVEQYSVVVIALIPLRSARIVVPVIGEVEAHVHVRTSGNIVTVFVKKRHHGFVFLEIASGTVSTITNRLNLSRS